MLDLILEKGTIIDGSGHKRYAADVGIANDEIVEIGDLFEVEAYHRINCTGLIICPGFLDMHSHSELMLLKNPSASPKIRQGITTELLGQDGISVIPVSAKTIPQWKAQLAGILGDSSVEWTWRSVDDYLNKLDRKTAINVATLVSHGNIRAEVMGMENREPTAQEMDSMTGLLEDALRQGAFGMSTGLIYPPCCYAKTPELIKLCKVVARNNGIFVIHLRSEFDFIVEAVNEILEVGLATQVPIHFSHMKVAGRANRSKLGDILKLLNIHLDKGMDITCDQYPYTAGSTLLAAILPSWVHEGGIRKAIERLKDPNSRTAIRKDIEQKGPSSWDNFIQAAGFENIIITDVQSEKNKNLVGMNLTAASQMHQKDPYDFVFDLLIDENMGISMVVFCVEEEDMITILKLPYQMVGTDGLLGGRPHPRAYGTYPRILGRYCREKEILTLEEAIHKMTYMPAKRLRLKHEGLIEEGMCANITIFNPETIIDRATYEEPIQYPRGIEYVIVNGTLVIDEGEQGEALPGRVFRK
jgi:N-acyl-D-amino-acid deacylase